MQRRNYIILILFSILLFASCKQHKTEHSDSPDSYDLKQIIANDTLRVATMYGSTSYFLFRDEYMGFDYEMATNLANYLHVNLEINIAKSETEMTQWLSEGKVDIVCYNTIETKALKKKFSFVFPQPDSYQVLVQNMGANALSDVTELEGESVYVKQNSIYYERLKMLNDEIGGSINIVLAADSLSDDDLIDMVSENKIKYTVASHNLAILHKSYDRKLDCHMPVSFNQHNGWLVRNGSHNLKNLIDKWSKLSESLQLQAQLQSKYWEKSPYFALRRITIPKGAISPFDRFFKKYAADIDWDWRLVAAVAFLESRFDPHEVSWAGAGGLMQLMPRTASNFGLGRKTIFDPELNIEAGVQYIKSLNLLFRQVPNNNERIKFILASYNSGPAHILDAMALAKKHGKNPQIWNNNVEFFLLKLSETQYYNDPVVKYGYYRGKETARYVQNALQTFAKYSKRK